MERKTLLTAVFAALVSAGAALASPIHQDGLGIGVFGGVSAGWSGGMHETAALSLKLPAIPVLWGVTFHGLRSGALGVGLQGDFYLLGARLFPALSWFFGLGAYAVFRLEDEPSVVLGGRIPLGASWHPASFVEAFVSTVASMGFASGEGGIRGGLGVEAGVRFWPRRSSG